MVRVRFAPSPTGNLHIGGARTAVFNWMYARSKGGKFILRIEDTDKERSQQQYVDEILDSLTWLGFQWDELHFQSKNTALYHQWAQRLLQEGKAFEEASFNEDGSPRGKAIIYKVEGRKVVVNDLIRGKIEFDTEVIKDQVLIKSDGSPTYNFACVVDDAAMEITHVIRGDDHISNTPKQVLLYEAMGFPLPQFAHLPLIMGEDGGRLSKRTGATAVSEFRAMGYLPEAVVNYLLLLSWSPGDNKEIIPVNEAIRLFDITDVNKTAATFDMGKLTWINREYIQRYEPQKLAQLLLPFLRVRGLSETALADYPYVVSVIKLFQPRLMTLDDFVAWADYFFLDEVTPEPQAREKVMIRDFSREFALFAQRLDALELFDVASIERCFRDLIAELKMASRELIHPVRVAVTGKTVGLGLFEVIYYLGKERTKKRLMKWVTPGRI